MVRRLLLLLAGLCAVALLLGAATYRFFPEKGLAAVTRLLARRAGLQLATVTVQGYRIPYYHGGSGPPLLLLHGFADSKMAFVQSAQWLAQRYTLYLPDLPGYGDTAREPSRSYGVEAQVQTLHAFAASLGLGELAVGGNSMGGHIAAAFALAYPNLVTKLLLLDPAGLRVDDPVPYRDQTAPVDTESKYDQFMAKVFVHRPWVPGPLKRKFVSRAIGNFAWLNRMLKDLRSDRFYVLNDQLKNIQAPTLILWGDGDGIISIKHAAVWQQGIPGAILVRFQDCGHAPQYERPQQTALVMLAFLEGRCTPTGCPAH